MLLKTKLLLPKMAMPAIVVLVAALVASMPVQSQLVDVGQPPSDFADSGPVDGGGPVELVAPLPMPEPHEAQSPQGLTTLGETSAVPAVAISRATGGIGDIPANVLKAYKAAAASINASDPSCHLDWTVLAGIGKVESGHARGGSLDASGRTTSPILGPQLSGGPDIAAIRDTDGGQYDGDTSWDRAVGPMQFIPSSWSGHAVDGNGDGKEDPSNMYDAALASAGYLCTGDRDLSSSGDLRQAVYGYNHSWDYVATVLAWAKAYEGGAVAVTPITLAAGSGGGTSSTRAVTSSDGSDRAAATRRTSRSPSPSSTPSASPIAVEAASTPASGSPTPTSSASASPSGSPSAPGTVAAAGNTSASAPGRPADSPAADSPAADSPAADSPAADSPARAGGSSSPSPSTPAPDPTTPAPDPTTPAPDPSTPAPDPTAPAPDPTPPAPDPTPSCPTPGTPTDPAATPPAPDPTTTPDPCATDPAAAAATSAAAAAAAAAAADPALTPTP